MPVSCKLQVPSTLRLPAPFDGSDPELPGTNVSSAPPVHGPPLGQHRAAAGLAYRIISGEPPGPWTRAQPSRSLHFALTLTCWPACWARKEIRFPASL